MIKMEKLNKYNILGLHGKFHMYRINNNDKYKHYLSLNYFIYTYPEWIRRQEDNEI